MNIDLASYSDFGACGSWHDGVKNHHFPSNVAACYGRTGWGNWEAFVCILTWRFAEMQVAVMRRLACMPWVFVVGVMILAWQCQEALAQFPVGHWQNCHATFYGDDTAAATMGELTVRFSFLKNKFAAKTAFLESLTGWQNLEITHFRENTRIHNN